MRKNIAKVLAAVLVLTMLFSLAACGKKDEKKPEETTPVASVVEDVTSAVEQDVTEAPIVDDDAQKQEKYEKMFKDLSTMDLYSKNLVMTVNMTDTIAMDVTMNESGDSKVSMGFKLEGKDVSFAMYTIGEDAYLELHSPEIKSEGETQAAQDLYYKSKKTGEDTFSAAEEKEEVDKIKDFKKEDIKSVKYIGTKDVDGVQCDVVEAVILVDQTSAMDTTEDASATVEKTEVTYNFYFTTDESKFFGMEANIEGSTVKATLPKDVSVEVPNAEKFEEVDDEKFSEASKTAVMLMFTGMMSTIEMPTEAPTE